MAVPIPLDLVLSGRDITEPRLSPDGARVGFVHRSGASSAISVVGVEPADVERIVTFGVEPAPGRGFGGGCWDWLATSSGIVHCGRDGELWEIEGASARRLTAHERTCRAPSVSRDGDLVVYVVDDAEVWSIDRATGSNRRIDDGRHEFCFDPAIAPDGTTVSWAGWSPPWMPWDAAERVDARLVDGEVATISAARPDDSAIQQPRFDADGTPTGVHDATGWLNVVVGGRNVLPEPVEHAGPTWGMGQRSYATTSDGAVVVARNVGGFGALSIVDADGGRREVSEGFVGTYGQVSAVGDRICALRSGPTTPPEVVLVDRGGGVRVVAAGGVVGWNDVELPAPQAVSIVAAGGPLYARRHRAAGASSRGLLCWIHGGPTDQWTTEFRPRLAYWCSRGWDVLVVDPRGSTGHGRAYQQALNGAWGRLDVDDTAALVEHAHAERWATPDTTVVIGGSSGGLTVLGLLADRPDLVAGGIASYPVSDLHTLADTTHRFEAHYTDTLVGPADEPGIGARFDELSPLHRAERIRGPLLLFHGTDDPVVPITQSERLVERIREGGGDVEFVVYDGEGHGFRDPVNVVDEYERMHRFLDGI
jgi:dipeptidyl aminopeptidase/acylaminoacyl peptidase